MFQRKTDKLWYFRDFDETEIRTFLDYQKFIENSSLTQKKIWNTFYFNNIGKIFETKQVLGNCNHFIVLLILNQTFWTEHFLNHGIFKAIHKIAVFLKSVMLNLKVTK